MTRYYPFGGSFKRIVDSKNRIYFPKKFRRERYKVIEEIDETFRLYPKNKFVEFLKNNEEQKEIILRKTKRISLEKEGRIVLNELVSNQEKKFNAQEC